MAEPKEPLTFADAPEVQGIAETLIDKHHRHLRKQEIKYLFRSEPETVHNATALATASKVSGLKAFLADSTTESLGNLTDMPEGQVPKPFFMVQVWAYGWGQLTHSQKLACVDHELSHFDVDDGKLVIVPHDLEEFQAVVERHGFWQPNIAEFVKAAERSQTNGQTSALRVVDPKTGKSVPIDDPRGKELLVDFVKGATPDEPNGDGDKDFRVQLDDGTWVGCVVKPEGKGFALALAGPINHENVYVGKATKSDIGGDPEGHCLRLAQKLRDAYASEAPE